MLQTWTPTSTPTSEALVSVLCLPASELPCSRSGAVFIINNDPTLPASAIKNITTFPNGTTTGDDIDAAGTGVWPVWKGASSDRDGAYKMLNLNMTGGSPTEVLWSNPENSFYVTHYTRAGLEAKFDIVDAWSWEGDKGRRCDLSARISPLVSE
jgi:hypothetical protein